MPYEPMQKRERRNKSKEGNWQNCMQIMTGGNTKQMSSEFHSAAFPM
jgi:hypothetical protein